MDLDFYNLFDFAGDHDLVLNEQDQDFLSSLPLPPQEVLPAAEVSLATSLMTSTDQPGSQAVYEAFRQSIGRWDPAKHHYRAAEQTSLTLDRITTSKMDCLGDWDPDIVSQNLTPSMREQILKLLIRSCDQDNVVDVISSFPVVEVLDRLLKSYLTRQSLSTDSWIHVPTFRLSEVRLELLIACVAASACLSPSRPVQKFGLGMQEFLVFHLWLMVSTNLNCPRTDNHELTSLV